MSERHLFLAFTNPVEGREADFDDWYTHHLPEVLHNAPGFVSGQRFVLDPLQRQGVGAGDPASWRYLAIYELEGDDLPATHAAIAKYSREGGFTDHGGALDPGHVAWVYSPCGPELTGGTSLGDEKRVFLALVNPAAGRVDDLNTWYDTYHVREILDQMPGFTTGRRYEAVAERQRPGQSPPWKYLALYDLEGDLAEIHARDAEVRASGSLTQPDGVFDRTSFGIWVFTPLGPAVSLRELEEASA